VSSTEGLLRFDGVRFFEWKPSTGDSLPRQPLHHLLGSRDGSLWIAGKGLAELKADGEFRRYHQLDGMEISALIEDKDGAIWAGGVGQPQSSKLCHVYRGESECFPPNEFLGSDIWALHEDGKGQLWVCTDGRIWRLRPGLPREFARHSGMILAFGEDAGGTLIFSNGSQMKRLTADGTIKPYQMRLDKACALLKDREGDLWIGTPGEGIIHVHQGRTDRFNIVDGLSFDFVYEIFQDREGSVWVATGNGLHKFSKPAVTRITIKQGQTTSVLTDRKGVSWVGTSDGLHRLVNGRLAKSTIKLPNLIVTSLFETSNGRMIVATNAQNGMVWLDGNKTSRFRTRSGNNVFDIAEDLRGDLWVSSRELGLLHLRGNGDLIETFERKNLGKFGVELAFDPKRDGLWLTSSLGELGLFKDGKFVEKYGAIDGLGEGTVRDPQVDEDGGVWVGTQVGLAHLENGKISVLSRKNGLPCDAVHWMRHDRDHNVWLWTECGLVAISESELSSWINRPSNTVAIAHYLDDTDGVENDASGGWYTPQTTTTSDGHLSFLTATAVNILDPSNLNRNILPPPVHIEEITSDEQMINGSGRIVLPARVHSVHIAFTAPTFTAPEKVRFRYRLQGYDTDWSPPVAFRQTTYTNLPPGNYEFRVIACNNNGVWNMTGATVSFFISPAFYQTLWFWTLMAITIAAMLWSLYLLRLKRATTNVQQRLLAQMEERERIARELHDTLLQGFQGITLRMHGVSRNLPIEDPPRKMMEEVLDRADEVLREARHRVRNLRIRATHENELPDRLTKCGEELSRDHAASFTLAIVGTPRVLEPTVQDEAYKIAGEALTNAFRHASASKIEVEVTYNSSALRIRVRDDGVGIDKAVVSHGQPGHWGLAGMRERAKAIRADINIWSRQAAGTEVELVIPASIAYPKRQS
jgi:signal transduction histidine kinase/ligand-binding sensor domain-containing protein